jgi:hypothetical protein
MHIHEVLKQIQEQLDKADQAYWIGDSPAEFISKAMDMVEEALREVADGDE